MKKIYLIPLVLLGALGIWMGIKMMNKEPKDPTVMPKPTIRTSVVVCNIAKQRF